MEKSNPKETEFDELLTDHFGEFGRFQWFVLVVFCYEWIMSGFVALCPVFVAGVPDHWCEVIIQPQQYVLHRKIKRIYYLKKTEMVKYNTVNANAMIFW